MHWSAGYVGMGWEQVGPELCWGLVRKVYGECAGIVVESYVDRHGGVSDDQATIAALLRGQAIQWPWQTVEIGAEREFDVAVFSRAGIESHVGIVVGPGRMLHLARDYDARIERFDQGRWRLRLAGLKRHDCLAGARDTRCITTSI